MTDILFGQSYYLKFDEKLLEAMQPYPPLGSLYAASLTRNRGYQVAFFDAMLAQSEAEWDQALVDHKPTFAVLFEDNFNYLSKMCLLRMREAAYTMIRLARRRGCIVIAGGADATDHPEAYLDAGVHYVLLGEGEQTLLELLDKVSGKVDVPLEAINGLAYKRENLAQENHDRKGVPATQFTRTPRRQDIKDLDSLPLPAWDLVDVDRYRNIWKKRHGYFSINMVTTRGCPYHCNWCAKPIWGQRYNIRSPENVTAEMVWIDKHYHPDHVWFMDDIFGLRPGWLSRFADLLEQNHLIIPFKCLSRADLLLRENDCEALSRAGCQIVWIGAESGSQKVLDAMEKGIRVQQIYESTRRLQSLGIQVGFFLQFGYPGESRDDIEKTFEMVRQCQPDEIGISVSYPLPGTRFYEAVKEQLGFKKNWFDSKDLAMLYQGPFSTAFYRQLHMVLHREFRVLKAWKDIKYRLQNGRVHLGKPIPGISVPRNFVRMSYNRLLLLWERRKLNRLERLPHSGLQPIKPSMSPLAASIPSTREDMP